MESLLYSFLAGISTVLGAVVVAFLGIPGKKLLPALLGFASGVMLAISLLDLLPEALEHGSIVSVSVGFLLGVGTMYALDRFIPHAHASSSQEFAFENVPDAPARTKAILRVKPAQSWVHILPLLLDCTTSPKVSLWPEL
jgi:ZIP family zinc transporter